MDPWAPIPIRLAYERTHNSAETHSHLRYRRNCQTIHQEPALRCWTLQKRPLGIPPYTQEIPARTHGSLGDTSEIPEKARLDMLGWSRCRPQRNKVSLRRLAALQQFHSQSIL